MKVISINWFHNCVGIIVADNSVGKRHIYRGTGEGMDEDEDVKRILELGTKCSVNRFESIIKDFKGE